MLIDHSRLTKDVDVAARLREKAAECEERAYKIEMRIINGVGAVEGPASLIGANQIVVQR